MLKYYSVRIATICISNKLNFENLLGNWKLYLVAGGWWRFSGLLLLLLLLFNYIRQACKVQSCNFLRFASFVIFCVENGKCDCFCCNCYSTRCVCLYVVFYCSVYLLCATHSTGVLYYFILFYFFERKKKRIYCTISIKVQFFSLCELA